MENNEIVNNEGLKVKKVSSALLKLLDYLEDDKKIVLASFRDSVPNKYPNYKSGDDRDVVFAAVKKSKINKEIPELSDDGRQALDEVWQEYVDDMKSRNPFKISDFSQERERERREVALEVVKEDGLMIDLLPNKLKDDKEIVVEAIKNNGKAYKYCNEAMQRDLDVIALANDSLKKVGLNVDDYICDALQKLKLSLGADTLEIALEVEAAEADVERIYGFKRRGADFKGFKRLY